MSKLQTIPHGYLSALGLKSSGRNPPDIVDFVNPSFDITEMYLSQWNDAVGGGGAVTAVGDFQTVTVPDGQAWFVRAASLSLVNCAAGDTLNLSLAIRVPTPVAMLGAEIFNSPSLYTVVTANADPGLGGWLPEPMLLRPGSQIVGTLRDGALAAPRTMVVSTLISRITV